ncbi:DUF3021 domain-containing protein [Nicoliella lavandulae]|uniref:DUF3021 domain-containing protein n=1 Tax=Nicoliella lavandulae TaxID=3082954 RepID=A0ABU8SJ11_9LACO
MRRILNLIIKYALIGMGAGSIIFLIILATYSHAQVSQSEIISLLVTTALVGEGTFIFHIWWLPFSIRLLIHYGIILISMFILGAYNGWATNNLAYTIQVTIIYLIVWAFQYYLNQKAASSVNKLIQKRKSDHH